MAGSSTAEPQQPRFYFDFASPDAYLAAEQVNSALAEIPEWVPVAIGPPAFRCAAEVDAYREDVERRSRALELQPGLPSALRMYAQLLMVLGRHDEAIDHARQALALDPMSVAAHVDLANVLIAARRFDAAARQLNEALALDPTSVPVYGMLASMP